MSSIWLDIKTGAVIAMGLIGSSLGQLADMLPDDISKIGTAVGIVLSIFLIRHHNASRKLKDAQRKLVERQLREGAKE